MTARLCDLAQDPDPAFSMEPVSTALDSTATPDTDTPAPLQVLLAAPRGFCAGVDRAIEIVELALKHYGPPVYVRHAIVHNTWVVETLERKGAVFVEDESEVPEGGVIVFSAHGVSPKVKDRSESLGLQTIDATCPLVTKVHLEVRKHDTEGRDIILIGHEGHQEVLGTTGNAPDAVHLVETPEDVEALDLPDPDRVAYSTQTTLSVDEAGGIIDAIKRKYPNAKGPKGDDICYATQNRQDATKELARRSDLVLVVGSDTSSNSKRMVEVARNHGAQRAELIDRAATIDPAWLDGVNTVGLTSGASAPEVLIDQVIDALRERPGGAHVELLNVVEENVHYALPAELRRLPVV